MCWEMFVCVCTCACVCVCVCVDCRCVSLHICRCGVFLAPVLLLCCCWVVVSLPVDALCPVSCVYSYLSTVLFRAWLLLYRKHSDASRIKVHHLLTRTHRECYHAES